MTITARRIILGASALLSLPLGAAAATPFTLEDIGSKLGLGTADLKSSVINILAWLLGIAALAAVVMIILGGLQWLTSAGNEEKVAGAKKTISSAVIGLILIILAWAIVIFVAGTTKNVTV